MLAPQSFPKVNAKFRSPDRLQAFDDGTWGFTWVLPTPALAQAFVDYLEEHSGLRVPTRERKYDTGVVVCFRYKDEFTNPVLFACQLTLKLYQRMMVLEGLLDAGG